MTDTELQERLAQKLSAKLIAHTPLGDTEILNRNEIATALLPIIKAYSDEQFNNSPRAYGKTLRQFKQFQEAIEEGKTAEWHGKDYVVLSRNQYEKLKKSHEVIVITEES